MSSLTSISLDQIPGSPISQNKTLKSDKKPYIEPEHIPVTTRVVFGFVKYLGGNVVRSGVDVKLLERHNGMFFDIGSAKSSRANGSFSIEYTLKNPNMSDLFLQVLNYGKPCTDLVKVEGALSEGPIDLIYTP